MKTKKLTKTKSRQIPDQILPNPSGSIDQDSDRSQMVPLDPFGSFKQRWEDCHQHRHHFPIGEEDGYRHHRPSNHQQRHHHYHLARRTRITTTSTSLKAKGWLPPPSQHSPSGEKDYYYHLPKGSRMVTATTTTSTTTTTSINRTKLFYSPHALWRGLSLAAKMVPRERNFPILLLQ